MWKDWDLGEISALEYFKSLTNSRVFKHTPYQTIIEKLGSNCNIDGVQYLISCNTWMEGIDWSKGLGLLLGRVVYVVKESKHIRASHHKKRERREGERRWRERMEVIDEWGWEIENWDVWPEKIRIYVVVIWVIMIIINSQTNLRVWERWHCFKFKHHRLNCS